MTTMDNSTVPPPYIPKHHAVFRCKVDNRMFKWPIIMLCIFDVVVFFMAPTILLGLISILWVSPPFLIVVLLARYLYCKTTYTIGLLYIGTTKKLRITYARQYPTISYSGMIRYFNTGMAIKQNILCALWILIPIESIF